MLRTRIADLLTLLIEGLVALLVLGSVWPFGSVQAFFQLILLGGVAVVLVLWAVKAALLGRPLWKHCLLVTLVAAFCCLPMLQVLPMQRGWIAAISPGTAQWLQDFRPPLADLPGIDPASQVDVDTLSFDAGATRDWLFRLIGFAALFAAVRNNLTDPAAAIRFAWLCVANASLLAIVGIGQMTSSSSNMVFWRIPTDGSVFGPFICRNHAAYVLNLAIGLAFGLLLGTSGFLPAQSKRRRRRRRRDSGEESRSEPSRHEHSRSEQSRRESHEPSRPMWVEMLRDGRVAWLLCGIGVCIAGLIATLSRGGGISLLAAGAVGLAALGGKATRRLLLIIVPIVGVAFCFLAFSGFDRVTSRWEKLVDDSVTPESRAAVWMRTAPLIGRFPVFGSGWGTFIAVEPTTRKPGDGYELAHDLAHNDFLQLWIEGGTLQLGVTVLLLIVLFRQGFKAVDRHRDTPIGRLAIGCLVGLTAILAHSFVDFGLHIPSIAVLAATVAAYLANIADSPPTAVKQSADPLAAPDAAVETAALGDADGLRPFAMVLQVTALLSVAGYLGLIGFREMQAERYRAAAAYAKSSRDLDSLDRSVAYLETAVSYSPQMTEARIKLAAAYVERMNARSGDAGAMRRVATALALLGGGGPGDAIVAVPLLAIGDPNDDPDFRRACPQIAIACRLSPASFDAQERLRKAQMLTGDAAAARRTVDRLMRMSPSEPNPWYEAGKSALGDHDEAQAIRDWRNCLLADKQYLPAILRAVGKQLADEPKMRNVLFSEDPVMLMRAAKDASKAEISDLDRILLQDAAAVLSRTNRTPEQDWMLGQVHKQLDEGPLAIEAMRRATQAQPRNYQWGAQFAKELLDADLVDEASIVARTAQSFMPDPRGMEDILKKIAKRAAEIKQAN